MNKSALEQGAAKMLCVGFSGLTPTDELLALLQRGVSNVVLFGRNCQSPPQVAELCAEIKTRAGHPVLISIDQEGGRVQRLREPFTIIPPMRALGQVNDEHLALQIGQILGRELRAVNIDIDFAPVVDVDSNPDNPVIASRSLSPDPQVVARLGGAIVKGIQSESVAACAKHYLGHGDTSEDSHHTLPRSSLSLARLQQIEMPPFKAAIDAGVASLMTAHVVFESIDPHYPVTMSRAALDGKLRDQWYFDGVVFSDDLEMKAIGAHFGLGEALIRGANAGIDVFCIAHSAEVQNRAIGLLAKALEQGKVPPKRLEQANLRVDAMIAKFYRPPQRGPLPALIGSAEHRAVIDRVRVLCDKSAFETGRDPTEFTA